MIEPSERAPDEPIYPLPDGDSPPPTPRWVKLFGIMMLVIVVVLVAIVVLGGHAPPVQHGP